ncbi:MAG: hypothetical protein AB7L13_19045 [Acidimicrobiia bacterium]
MLFLTSLARAAGADPARPTNFSSKVTAIVPPTAVARFEIVGGDSFLSAKVEPGHTVVVMGYENEPYLRVNADGSIDENTKSPAVALNANRYGATRPDPDADAKAEPVWTRKGGGGEIVWHDHRVHWMSTSTPPGGTNYTAKWTVPVVVDGAVTSVNGTLALLPAPSDYWIWIVAAVAVGALAGIAVGSRGSDSRVKPIGLAGAAAVVLAIALATEIATPALVGRRSAVPVLAGLALVTLVVAAVVRSPYYRSALVDGAGVAFVLVAWLSRSAVSHAVLVSDVAGWLQRLVFSVALASVVAIVAARIPRPALPDPRKVPA